MTVGPSKTLAPKKSVMIGFDPGKDKCGVAVMDSNRVLYVHKVVPSKDAIATLNTFCSQYPVSLIILGDQTTSKDWRQRLQQLTPDIVQVDERYSTLEARNRYWEMYPPQGFLRLLPQGLRTPPRPIDDIVAIILIERYLQR